MKMGLPIQTHQKIEFRCVKTGWALLIILLVQQLRPKDNLGQIT